MVLFERNFDMPHPDDVPPGSGIEKPKDDEDKEELES